MESLERKKLLELIVFFVTNTKRCGLVKLFKLLYFTDMLHFKETGRSVSGLIYKALPYGPVPTSLYSEFKSPPSDLSGIITITSPPISDSETPIKTNIAVKNNIGTRYLTKRELRIAGQIAEIFCEVNATDTSDISHERLGPWDRAVKGAEKAGKNKWGAPIDYFDSVKIKIGTGQLLDLNEMRNRHEEFESYRNSNLT